MVPCGSTRVCIPEASNSILNDRGCELFFILPGTHFNTMPPVTQMLQTAWAQGF